MNIICKYEQLVNNNTNTDILISFVKCLDI